MTRLRKLIVAAVVCAVCLVGVIAGSWLWTARTSTTPSCSWPVRVRGPATAEQVGLVRCYLRSLARRSTSGLTVLMAVTEARARITSADFQYAADARSTPATATFRPNPVDPTDVTVTIAYRDGALEEVGLTNMVAFGGPSVWRMDIGSMWDAR